MVNNQARFHLTMLLSRYSNQLADVFATQFNHRERERSSVKSEINEINDFWYNRVRVYDPMAAKLIRELPDNNIDQWIAGFRRDVIDRIMSIEDQLCRQSA